MNDESEKQIKPLSIEILREAIAKNAAAFRLITRLMPAGGPGGKVFPPTHSGGVYAWEKRRISKDEVICTVLLDSVQSQANRMELALLEAYQVQKLKIPIVQIDFSEKFPDIGCITTLELPHRIADAFIRESKHDETDFLNSEVGKDFEKSDIRHATGLYKYCPHALIFGVWNSTGSKGGLGNKFQRALVSEIVGINAEKGVRTSSRIDPIIHVNPKIYKDKNGNWTAHPESAEKDDKGQLKKYEKKLSKLNLGNIPPDLVRYDPKDKKTLRTMYEEFRPGDVLPGGVTIDHAIQTTVLSLPALRRLRFPLLNGEDPLKVPQERNNAARTALAALALAAICHSWEHGYDLRSRCLLIPEAVPHLQLVKNDGSIELFALNADCADKILREANSSAVEKLLPEWDTAPIPLKPNEKLIGVIEESRKLHDSSEEDSDGEE